MSTSPSNWATIPSPSFSPTAKYTLLPLLQSSATTTSQPSQKTSITETPTTFPPTNTATITRISGRIAVVIQLWGDIVIGVGDSIEFLDENFTFLYRFPSNNVWLSSFSTDGCYLRAINFVDGSFIIRELDLNGGEIKQTTVLPKEVEDNQIYQFTLSPSGRWLAYKVVDQVQMNLQGAKKQDVKLIQTGSQSPQEAQQLTERGGAHPAKLAWSPDNHYLAYTDYDDAGITQIYVFNPDEKQEYQITHFDNEMREHEIQVLSWSPDSQKIAFSIVGVHETDAGIEMTDKGAIGIISLPEFNLKWLKLDGYESPKLYNQNLPGSTTLWWSKNSQSLLIPFSLEAEKDKAAYLAWYDLKLEKVVHLISNSDFYDVDSFWSVFPLNGIDKIGIRGSKADYIYNRDTKEIVKLKKEYFLKENSVFLVAPNGPVELTQCFK